MKNYRYFYYISIALLLITLDSLPYGYYTFLRIFIYITALYTLVESKLSSLFFFGWIFMAIIYNPIIKIHLEKEDWTPVNIITAMFVGYYLWTINKAQKE